MDTDKKQVLLERMNALFNEESLILKRNLTKSLGRLCKHFSKDILFNDIQNHFKNLVNDDSESVRITVIDSLVELAKVCNQEENITHLIP